MGQMWMKIESLWQLLLYTFSVWNVNFWRVVFKSKHIDTLLPHRAVTLSVHITYVVVFEYLIIYQFQNVCCFFSEVISELEKQGNIKPMPKDEVMKFMDTPLKCHKCSFLAKNMPTLKSHILVHLKKLL